MPEEKTEGKPVTIKIIAQQCGLSVAAVSKALNRLPGISQEKAELVRQTAQELGYFPNAAARTLKTSRSKNIGILFQNCLTHEYFSVVLESIRITAEARGYDITFLSKYHTSELGYLEHVMKRQCDGVITAPSSYDRKDAQPLIESGIPVVSIDEIFNGHTAVMSDNAGSMEEVVRYLHSLGHERIAYIHGEMGHTVSCRLAGFHRGCRSCGIEVPEEYIIPARFHEPKDSGLATRKLLGCKVRPTCILYPDDISYLGGLTELESQGLRVPEDISCFGYDGIHISTILRPQLSTYRQNAEAIGRIAAEQLISAIEEPKFYVPQVITVPGEVLPGATVKNLRA